MVVHQLYKEDSTRCFKVAEMLPITERASVNASEVTCADCKLGLVVFTADGCGELKSAIEREDEIDIGSLEYNAAIDGIESFVLALACAGVDVQGDPRFQEALETALEAAGNHFDDDTPVLTDRQRDALKELLDLARHAVKHSEYGEDRAQPAREKWAVWAAGKYIEKL